MRPLFVIRSLVGLWFGSTLLLSPVAALDMFVLLANYLIADGMVGIALAVLLFRDDDYGTKTHVDSLAAAMLIDAVGRVCSGLAVRVWPGIPGFPLSAVAFIVIMAGCTAAIGIIEGALVVEEEVARLGPRHARPEFSIPPVLCSALISIAFGVAAIAVVGNHAVLRPVMGGYVLAAGVVMLTMAWTRHRSPRDLAARP